MPPKGRGKKPEKEPEPTAPAVFKSKKDAKSLFNKLDERARKIATLNQQDFVEGMYDTLHDLDNPGLGEEGTATVAQLESLWRTLETEGDGEVKIKEFISRFTVGFEIKKPTKGGRRTASGPRPEVKPPSWSGRQTSVMPNLKVKKCSSNELMSIFHTLFDNTKIGARALYKRFLTAGHDVEADAEDDPEAHLPSLSLKQFKKGMDQICLEEREKAAKLGGDEMVPFWACAPRPHSSSHNTIYCGLGDHEVEQIFTTFFEKKESGKTDLAKFTSEILIEEDPPKTAESTKSTKSGKGQDKKKPDKKKPDKKNSDKKSGGKKETWKNPEATEKAFKLRNDKHKDEHNDDYKFHTVDEDNMHDFVNDLILNNEIASGKDILCEPPLVHWTTEEIAAKGVSQAGNGYNRLLFLPNKTHIKKVLWSDIHSGPIIFCTYVIMFSSRSTSRWLYHCQLHFDKDEHLMPNGVLSQARRQYTDGYLDTDETDDHPLWQRFVPNTDSDDDHEYRTLKNSN